MSLRNNFLSATFSLLLIIVCSCAKQEQTLALNIPLAEVSAERGNQFIYVESNDAWTLSIDFGDAESWASLDTTSGKGNKSGITLSWNANSDAARSLDIILQGKTGKSEKRQLTQAAKNSGSSGGNQSNLSTTDATWLELPATDKSDLIFITHDMQHGGKRMRNWSCYYDKEAKLSHWVAYPLNRSLIGSGGRTNAWDYDPSLQQSYQPRLYNAYQGGYDRGHQLPSADRLSREANITSILPI